MTNKPVRIKICGITSLEDARFISGLQADYLGFIFYEGSQRYISPQKAGAIINWIHGPQPVGVFVNHSADAINEITSMTGVELVQLHGTESPEECAVVNRPVIKVIHIDEKLDPPGLEQKIAPYLNVVDYIMFDTSRAGMWGGTGERFDWGLLTSLHKDIPYFLSGGIGKEHVAEAIRSLSPFALDISSSVEKSPGVKDFDKVEELFDTLRELA